MTRSLTRLFAVVPSASSDIGYELAKQVILSGFDLLISALKLGRDQAAQACHLLGTRRSISAS